MNIPVEGLKIPFQDITRNSWLNPKEPDFSIIENGYHYETITLRRDFNESQEIKLPNGTSIVINNKEKP